jgi:GATA zinc finger
MDTRTISASLQPCLRLFNDFAGRNDLAAHEEVSNASWHEQLGRLRIWSANIGAHQTGHSSLDYRLRDASHIRKRILSLLDGLKRALEETIELLQDDEPLEEDLLDLESGQEVETEIQQLFRVIANKIKCLFQMSMLIRKPANRDRLLRARADEAATFEPLYRNHVGEKYPRANPAVLDNLAMGIARRKAELMCHERHHIKLSQGLDEDSERKSRAISETIASDFKDKNIDFDDLASTSALTQTSYAPSLEGGNAAVSVPPPPKDCEYGEPFECPYCFFIITMKSRRSWTRHVFKDLMPYSCVFEDCAESKRIFDSRHEWFNHELKTHLGKGMVMDVLADALCPLCHEEMPIGRLERHLARHLEELALFVIIHSSDELEDSDQSQAAKEESGNYAGDDSSNSTDEERLGHQTPNQDPSHVINNWVTQFGAPSSPAHSQESSRMREEDAGKRSPPNWILSDKSYDLHSNSGDRQDVPAAVREEVEQSDSSGSISPRFVAEVFPNRVTKEQSVQSHSEAKPLPFIRPVDIDKRIAEEKERERSASEEVLEQIRVKDCANCHTRVTPEWRRGPSGRRDLCNNCGLSWAASGDKLGKMDALKTMPKLESAISTEPAPQLSHVEEMSSGDLLDRYFEKPASESTFRPEGPLDTEYASKVAPNAGETSNNTWSNPDRQGSEDDAVEEIVERRVRRSRTPSPYHDYETRKVLERLKILVEEKAEEEAQKRYKAGMEIKKAKEQLEKAEEEQKSKELAKKAIEDWQREEDAKKAKAKQEKEMQDKLIEERLRQELVDRKYTSEEIEQFLKKEKDADRKHHNETRLARARPTYIKVHTKYLLPETLDVYDLPWSYDKVGKFFGAVDT